MTERLHEHLSVDRDGWRLTETGWDGDRSVAVGSNFMVGNGYLGYRGTAPDQHADGFVALVVSDTYDCADGHWRELTTAPNPLYAQAGVGGRWLRVDAADEVETALDLRADVFEQRCTHRLGRATVWIHVERVASADDLHVLAQRWTLTTDRPVVVDLRTGIDADIWSLNGTHLPVVEFGRRTATLTAVGETVDTGVTVAVASTCTVSDGFVEAEQPDAPVDGALVIGTASVAPGSPLVVETVAAVVSSNDGLGDAQAAALDVLSRAGSRYEPVRDASAVRWAQIWHEHDVRIEGSVLDDAALRFSSLHNRICTPAHSDRLPIGARGLSCQAYQGAAFWDQEVYNLPAFLFTEPELARNLLVYRHRTLDGARRKARRLGYDGAYFAWISGDTGDELCPDVFFTDVLTGRPIRNHFNVWQMHVAPDIVTSIARYVDVTDDLDFLVDHGAEVAFEVARFLRSFVRYDDWRGVYHCIRLLGPDEWHENVDDNAFTNHQTHAALDFAIDTFERLAVVRPDALTTLRERLAIRDDEVDGWRRVRDLLLLPQSDPETGLVEQFDGFFELEDIRPDHLRTRLIEPTEYWGWPNGIAVRTQVSKQADVPMLLWLRSERFDEATARANYEYYEPRCSHNSSLSHAAHGMVAVRIGEVDRALEHFRATARVDLLNTNHPVVGGTFIGGIHTAACGGTYQLAVNGFGGLDVRGGALAIDPHLPDAWSSISYPVSWRGQRLVVLAAPDVLTLQADAGNTGVVTVLVDGADVAVAPGARVEVERSRG